MIPCAECNLTAPEVRELAAELEVNDPACCIDGLILLTEPRDPEGWEGGFASNH